MDVAMAFVEQTTEVAKTTRLEYLQNVNFVAGSLHLCLKAQTPTPTQKLAGRETGVTQHRLRRLQQIVSVQGWVNLEPTVCRILNPIRGRLRNDFRPLLNRATRVTDCSSDRRPVAIVISQDICLSHSTEGTAC